MTTTKTYNERTYGLKTFDDKLKDLNDLLTIISFNLLRLESGKDSGKYNGLKNKLFILGKNVNYLESGFNQLTISYNKKQKTTMIKGILLKNYNEIEIYRINGEIKIGILKDGEQYISLNNLNIDMIITELKYYIANIGDKRYWKNILI